jgi:site-specific recombinase XerD
MPNSTHHPSTPCTNQDALRPLRAGKDRKHRLTWFVAWLDDTGGNWLDPDLRAYRDYLLTERHLSVTSAVAHLSTVRGHYRELARDRATFGQKAGTDDQAAIETLVAHILSAIHPDAAPLARPRRPPAAHLRLTQDQARQLIDAPDTSTPMGQRDQAVLALLLTTGIREAELWALDIQDLDHTPDGAPALHVKATPGGKERLVPYSAPDLVVPIVGLWLAWLNEEHGLNQGPLFYSFYKGGWQKRKSRMTLRTVRRILARYPIPIAGQWVTVKPMDLRTTYARWLYARGVDLAIIQIYLGHGGIQRTRTYIGLRG